MPRSPGERIDRFEILGLLGAGGCGEVYRARNDAGDVVALKVLTSTSPPVVAHFERELDATPAHPNIRRVRRKGAADDGTRWLEMDYLEGDSLHDRMGRGPLPWRDVLAVGAQTCAALQAAHAAGVVHRDLKPDNIFVGPPPGVDVRVVDFSIALLQDAERLTRTGLILGTFQYMSPEQVRGDRRLDARSDIWSLGAVLYECVTGRCPFASPTLAGLVYSIAFQDLEPVTRLRPDTPPRLAEAIHRALSKDPADRFPTAQALREALAGVRAPDEGAATPTPARGPSAPTQPEDLASERALLSLAFLTGVAELGRVAEAAAVYGGELVPFADRKAIVRLGGAALRGDEPERAVRLACAVLPCVDGAGVATGWSLTPDRVEGSDLASRAERLAAGACVAVDVATAGAVRERVAFTESFDGGALLTAAEAAAYVSGARPSAPAAEAAGFFGRDALVRELIASASATSHAGVTAAVVLGEAGLGKSRLMQEALLRRRDEEPTAAALECRCTSYRQDLALGAWQELFESGGVDVDLPSIPRDTSIAPEVMFDRVTAAVEPALRALAERGPLVLAIDDAHWIDALSARLIEWIAEYATEVPVALWLFGRPDRWAAPLQALAGARTLAVGPLDDADARRLLVSAIGEAPAPLVERAAGNPLFLKELARLHVQRDADLPAADEASLVDLVFGARLARLDAPRRDFARRAAVVGRVAWVEAVQAMGADAQAWRKLLADKVFQRHPRSSVEGAQEFSFTSELMTEVAYRLWPAPALPAMHEVAARWLDARPDASPSEVGRHWERAGRHEEAAAAFARAAEAAARVGDAARAVEWAGRVVRLSADPEVQWRALAAQDAVFQLYADKDQQVLQERGLEQMRRLSIDLSLRHTVEVAWRQCYFYRITGGRDLAVAFGEEALALAPALGDDAEEGRWLSAVRNELALLHADAGAFEEALGHATEAREHASRLNDPWWLARTCFSEAYVIIELGRVEEALGLFESAAAGYAAGGDRRREAIARMNGGYALLRLGRLDDAERHFDDAIALSRKVGNRRTVAVTTQNRCTLLRARGDLTAAAAALDEAARAAERLRFARLEAAVSLERAWLALAQAGQGAAPEASALARAARLEAERVGSPALVAQGVAAELMAARHAGRRDAAAEARARALPAAGATPSEEEVAVAVALALLTGAADDEAAARGRLRAFLAAAVRSGDVGACVEGFALRYGLPAVAVRGMAG